LWSQTGPRQKCKTLSEKQIKQIKAGSMAEVVKHLPGKWDVLISKRWCFERKRMKKRRTRRKREVKRIWCWRRLGHSKKSDKQLK
jgi:hypothetical protein